MPDPADTRRSLYRAEDVAGLAKRKLAGRKHETLATNALFGSEPSIPTALCSFVRGRPHYRGQDAVSLARVGHAGRRGATVVGGRPARRLFVLGADGLGQAWARRCFHRPGRAGGQRPFHARAFDPGAAQRGPESGRSIGQCLRCPARGASHCICASRRDGNNRLAWPICCERPWCCWWTTS